ncbi:TonB-linked outer membrane protein, SusC/RagA family [Mucilaginibacter pineti]|uniref:TonB-linked outer membrane protein, SusC/RagA family n=1 Tax=Mucilaginibacter pineti TaxID=1391627 RepID=A0A1G6U9C6_9SPHI|nr:TonB-dependent receptor [Mucilaginibacter pineti]SDD37899.1 TonB-linked outer membrane protein, SusC/RagA family [Mucilaginibacter pineti]
MKFRLRNLHFGVSKKTIAISPLVLLLAMPVCAFASVRAAAVPVSASPVQALSISGKVADAAGVLPGVSVTEKGTANGTLTDGNGNFKLQVKDQNAILVFSFLGYTTQEVPVADKTILDVVLAANVKALNEVVVIGYGTQKKKDVTGAVTSVNIKEISSQPVPDIGQAIEGRAAGVQALTSGSPGSNVTIRVRGVGTINNADPLLVIDGVPTDVPLNTINPDDVASFDVLKDASAAAIYGSRGANGVVLITTKKGSAGASHLNINAFAGVQKATNMVKLLNASQFAQLNNELLANNNQSTNPAYADPKSLGAGTNWLDALFRTAPIQSYTLSYSGGTDKSDYYVSGSVLDQKGIIIGTGYRRYTVQFNGNNKVLKWLKFGNNLTLNHDEKPSGSYDIRSAMAANPAQAIFNADGTYAGPVGQPQFYGDVKNPIATANLVKNNTEGYNLLGSVYAEATILPGLTFKTTGGMQASFFNSRTWSPKYNYQPIPQPNSYLAEQYNRSITYTWDNFLTYDKFFGKDHHLTLLAGTDAQSNAYHFAGGNVSGFASDVTQQLNNGTLNPVLQGDGSEWSLLSYVGRANYTFKDRYLLTATIRRDGSSRFGDNNKYGTFPSASLAWRVTQEPFFKNITFFDDLKIRAGYGETGNQNIGNYSFASVLTSAVYNFNGTVVPAEIALNAANPNLHWETVKQSNLGIDATFLNQRITLNIDGYIKKTTGMLVPINLPISTGYSGAAPYGNAGNVENKGIEIAVTSKNLTGSFGWTTSANISFNKNKITALSDNTSLFGGSIGLNGNININSVGHPINSFYGFVTQGIFQTQFDVDAHAAQQTGADPYNRTSAGDIRFKDLNNDNVINDADRTYIGNPNPKFIYAMNNTFSYKGVDLSVFLQGVQGNKIFNANNVYQESMAVAQNQTTRVLGRWEGEGTSNSIPRAIYNDPNKNSRISDRFVEDGSYLRIKTATLGYTVPQLYMKRIGFSSARLYVTGQNLFTFTKYTGFDPEVGSNGIDFSVYPVTRTISLGINLTL